MNKGRLIKNQFENNNYIRLANSSNHWVDFSYKKLQGFINNFGNDFNLVIQGQVQKSVKVLKYQAVSLASR